jgi:hypothetical protein
MIVFDFIINDILFSLFSFLLCFYHLESDWSLEYARSDRSTCRSCRRNIAFNDLRWIEEYADDYEQKRFYHYACIEPDEYVAEEDPAFRSLKPADKV